MEGLKKISSTLFSVLSFIHLLFCCPLPILRFFQSLQHRLPLCIILHFLPLVIFFSILNIVLKRTRLYFLHEISQLDLLAPPSGLISHRQHAGIEIHLSESNSRGLDEGLDLLLKASEQCFCLRGGVCSDTCP